VILTNGNRVDPFLEAVRQHLTELLLGITPLHDTDQIIQGQAQVVGQDNATRRAQLAAARSFKADPAHLEALAGEYQSLTGDKPSTVTVADGRKLSANLSLMGGTFDGVELIPVASNDFLPNTVDLMRGFTVSFKEADDKTTLILNGVGAIAQK
jgi:hypothetical protein